MELAAASLHAFLVSRGVNSVFHANSVFTASHFLNAQQLLSRGQIEDRQLCQTSQYTDGKDEELGVWNDVFVDSCDIHARKRGKNSYGPVILEFDVALIKTACNERVWVTKSNPADWGDHNSAEWWFASAEELSAGFNVHTFAQMIVFRDCNGEVPFSNYLKQIVLDDPQLRSEAGEDVFELANRTLAEIAQNVGLNVPIVKRQCQATCQCSYEYKNCPVECIQKMFLDRCPG